MKARILNYRQGRHTITQNQLILDMGLSSGEEANKKVGTKVIYKTKNGEIHGVITSPHGRKGKLRARFNRGIPGQAIGKFVEIKTKNTKKSSVKKSDKKTKTKKSSSKKKSKKNKKSSKKSKSSKSSKKKTTTKKKSKTKKSK